MARFAWVFAVGLSLLGTPTSSAARDRVEHEKFTIGPEVTDFAAGEACEFAARLETTAYVNRRLFYDEQGNLVRVVAQIEEVIRVVNVETGYALDERLHFAHKINFVTGEHVDTGNVWHVRDAEGTLVYVGAGRVVMDLVTGEVLEATPNTGMDVGLPDYVSVVETYCRLLAGPTARP